MLVPFGAASFAALSLLLATECPPHTVYLGGGGTGSVFKVGTDKVLKIAEPTPSASLLLKHECRALRRLEVAGVANVPRCLDACVTIENGDAKNALLLEPYMQATDSPVKKATEVSRKIMKTTVDAIAKAHVALTDVQILADGENVLIIDWDHSYSWEGDPGAVADMQILSFVQEALALASASSSFPFAAQSLVEAIDELKPLGSQKQHLRELVAPLLDMDS